MFDFLQLLWGTVVLRPYVFAFLAVYLVAAGAHMGWKRTLVYLPVGYLAAWMSEFASITWGFPYGDYYYIEDTIERELWVLGVPFMDSLSYVFLSYCSYSTAVMLLSPNAVTDGSFLVLETRAIRRSRQTLVLGACLFVFLDIIIDPVALQGYRWFLGQIYGYRSPGVYFGIPMSNFAGWLVVGLAMTALLQALDRMSRLDSPAHPPLALRFPILRLLGPLLYVSVLAFNLTVTFRIGENLLGAVSSLLIFHVFLMCFFFTAYKLKNVSLALMRAHFADFPPTWVSEQVPSSSPCPSRERELSQGVPALRRAQGEPRDG